MRRELYGIYRPEYGSRRDGCGRRLSQVALLQIDDGAENPLPGLSEFRELLKDVEASRAEPAKIQPLTVIGSYRLL